MQIATGETTPPGDILMLEAMDEPPISANEILKPTLLIT